MVQYDTVEPYLVVAVGYGSVDPLQKVQVGKDQEKAQSEKDSHSKNRGGNQEKAQSEKDSHSKNRGGNVL